MIKRILAGLSFMLILTSASAQSSAAAKQKSPVNKYTDNIDDRMKGPHGEKIYIGPNGGRYYIKKGDKIYIVRKANKRKKI